MARSWQYSTYKCYLISKKVCYFISTFWYLQCSLLYVVQCVSISIFVCVCLCVPAQVFVCRICTHHAYVVYLQFPAANAPAAATTPKTMVMRLSNACWAFFSMIWAWWNTVNTRTEGVQPQLERWINDKWRWRSSQSRYRIMECSVVELETHIEKPRCWLWQKKESFLAKQFHLS